MESTTTYWTAADEAPATREDAEKVWVDETHRILTRVAGTYRGLIESSALASELQETTGFHTRAQVRTWIAPVLATVARECQDSGEPPLTSLVVLKASGMVGPMYDAAMRLSGDAPPETDLEREKHAAAARHECYLWAGADMPADGGSAALSERYAASESRARKARLAEAVPNVCPSCFMAIPPTGICDNCD